MKDTSNNPVPSTDAVSLFLAGERGINLPMDFMNSIFEENWKGIHEMHVEALKAGPGEAEYWDYWQDVLYNASYTDTKGNEWTLHQDGDLFLVCKDLMSDDDYMGLFGELPDGVMTEEEVQADFKENILPLIIEQYGEYDEIAIDTEFNDYTDSLCKDGQITDWLYNNITYEA